MAAKKEDLNTNSLREAEVESFISGLGLAKNFNKKYKKTNVVSSVAKPLVHFTTNPRGYSMNLLEDTLYSASVIRTFVLFISVH